MQGLIGKKIGMTQIWDESGAAVPVTVVEVGPCPVVQVKTAEKDGYTAAQIGFIPQKPQRLSKAERTRFEKAGVLRDPGDESSVIPEITADSYPPLKADGTVSKGMIPKIENALKAVEQGVRGVTIRSSEHLGNGIGTVIRK